MFAVMNGRICYVRTDSLAHAHLIAHQLVRGRPSLEGRVYVREVSTNLTC